MSLAAYVAETVATFPPLTPAQLDRVAILLNPRSTRTIVPRTLTEHEIAVNEARNLLEDLKLRMAKAVSGCRVCALAQDVIGTKKATGWGSTIS